MFLPLTFSVALLTQGAWAETDLKTRAEAVVTVERNLHGAKRQAAMAAAFKQIEPAELEAPALKTYDTRTLEVLFEAVDAVADDLDRPDLTPVLERVMRASIEHGWLGHMAEQLFSRYVRERDLKKARSLADEFESKSMQLPNIVEPSTPAPATAAIYRISADGKTLTYEPVDLSKTMIVSAVSPGCHFSNDVVALIDADPWLSAVIRKYAVNIEAAPDEIDADELAAINRKGGLQYSVLYRESGWNGLKFNLTPRFYFLKDGKVVYKIADVLPPEFKERFKEGFAHLGLPEP